MTEALPEALEGSSAELMVGTEMTQEHQKTVTFTSRWEIQFPVDRRFANGRANLLPRKKWK